MTLDIKINDEKYREIRCPRCRKLMGYEYVYTGRLAFECPRCSHVFTINLKNLKYNGRIEQGDLPALKILNNTQKP